MRQEPSSKPLTVAIVEDHPEFRQALLQALTHAGTLKLLDVCKDLPAGLAMVQRDCPDVLLVDLGLPSGSGLKLIRAARRQWGNRCTPAVLTVTGNEEHLMTAVAAGAKGYLFKSDAPAQWRDSVNLLLRGHSPLHARVARVMLDALADPARGIATKVDPTCQSLLLHLASGYLLQEAAERLQISADDAGARIRRVYDRFLQPAPDLTPRELELLSLLNRGLTFKQCATQMGIGEATIKTHAARAYEKLGASNLQMALYEARQAGLLA